jgi:hypothetical protein
MLRDLSKLSGGKRVCGTHLVGVLASELPTGFPLAGLINNDVSVNDPPNCLYRVEVTERPDGVVWQIDEDGSFTFSGPDGVYTGPLTNYKNDVPEEGSYSFTIGGGIATVTSVVVSPANPSIVGGGTQQFSAVVNGTNSPSQDVTWSTTAGSISADGLFTAPAITASIQTITVTATSVFDDTQDGSTVITIPASVVPTVTSVVVSPVDPVVAGGATQQFTAVVNGTNSPSQDVTWTVTGAAEISDSGLFTAPTATDEILLITVTATSALDGTKFGVSVVSIPAEIIIPIYPHPSTVLLGTQYGPTGTEFTGTMVPQTGSGASAAEIAAAVWAYETALSIPNFVAIK